MRRLFKPKTNEYVQITAYNGSCGDVFIVDKTARKKLDVAFKEHHAAVFKSGWDKNEATHNLAADEKEFSGDFP